MLEASFGTGTGAAVSGAYQHDRGQRLRLRGLPPPDVLAQMDELVSGEAVTVQAQYAFAGDSQTETRLAVWDDMQGVWTAAVPDVYMTRCEDVHVYVYVIYGQSEDGQRAKTCYEAVFRPESRPAPGDGVTPGQVSAWDALVQEVNLAIAGTNTAAASANGEATAAREAADRADAAAKTARQTASAAAADAKKTAEQAASWLKGIRATATTLAPGTQASATVTDGEAGPVLAIGVPKGEKGSPGVATINGIAVTDGGSVTLTAQEVGARPDDWTPTAQEVGAVSCELVWENASPTTAMAADGESSCAIQVDWTGYSHVLVIYAAITTTPDNLGSALLRAGTGNGCMLTMVSGASDTVASRNLEMTAQGIRVYGASLCLKGTIQTAAATLNKYCIPRYVYGIRGVKGHE